MSLEQFNLYVENPTIELRNQIVEENRLDDGSLLIKIKKQYNNYDCGEYMD